MRASGEIEIGTRRQKSRGIESIGGTIEKKRFTKIFRILLKIVFLKKRRLIVFYKKNFGISTFLERL